MLDMERESHLINDINNRTGSEFERLPSPIQELTFEAAEETFKRHAVDFASVMLDIRNGQYNNLALLFSDQCPHTTKIALYAADKDFTVSHSKEFDGSLFKQMEDSFAYLTLCNRTAATFSGLVRIDRQDYPEDALREALLNAFAHRDYSYSGSIIINIRDAGMEFITIGGLLPGLTPKDIQIGICQPRNRQLAEIFRKLRLIESYGTGICKIFSLYKDWPVQPQIEATPNSFKLTLPSMNAKPTDTVILEATTEKPVVTPQMQTVLDYLADRGEMTDEELQSLLNIKRTRSYLLARKMSENELIDIVGRGVGKKYRLRRGDND